MSEQIHHCGHGVSKELPTHRNVRIWLMNCGEVRCSLSERDYFQPQFINEWIDAAIDGKGKPGEWLELDRKELKRIQRIMGAIEVPAPVRVSDAPEPGDVWEHRDGGSMYIISRSVSRDTVKIQRRPFGDSQAEPFNIRRSVFDKIQRGRINPR